jgi:hypothetical protein
MALMGYLRHCRSLCDSGSGCSGLSLSLVVSKVRSIWNTALLDWACTLLFLPHDALAMKLQLVRCGNTSRDLATAPDVRVGNDVPGLALHVARSRRSVHKGHINTAEGVATALETFVESVCIGHSDYTFD